LISVRTYFQEKTPCGKEKGKNDQDEKNEETFFSINLSRGFPLICSEKLELITDLFNEGEEKKILLTRTLKQA
jgi:hypothetical protein